MSKVASLMQYGLLAARPPAGTAGQRYFATDTSIEYIDNGSAWMTLIATGAVVASVSGTAPIASSGGATPAISIAPATNAAAGSLSAADKAKLDALSSIGGLVALQDAPVDEPFSFLGGIINVLGPSLGKLGSLLRFIPIIGPGNTNSSTAAIVVGSSNTNSGDGDGTFGSSNANSGANTVQVGQNHQNQGSNNIQVGNAHNDNAGWNGCAQFGDGTAVETHGALAQGAAAFSGAGDAQTQVNVLKSSTPGVGVAESTTVTLPLANSKTYGFTVKATATRMGLGTAARQTAYFHIEFIASVRSGGTVDVSAVTTVVAPILQGAGFVAATLVPTGSANLLTITFTIGAGLTVQSRIVVQTTAVEVTGN